MRAIHGNTIEGSLKFTTYQLLIGHSRLILAGISPLIGDD